MKHDEFDGEVSINHGIRGKLIFGTYVWVSFSEQQL